MTYVDNQYINVARKNEMQHHKHTMDKLQAKISQLTKSVAWELKQHQSRIKELQQVEATLSVDRSSFPTMNTQQALEPVPSSKRRGTKTRKNVYRSTQKPVAQLVG